MRAVVYAGTRNLYSAMVAAVKSLLTHTAVDAVYLLIEDDAFPFDMPSVVKTINVSEQEYFRKDGPNYHSHWTYMVMLKAALHRIFPDLDKILCMDVDTIVREDISELWDIPLDDYYLAAVKEPRKSAECGSLYINAGVMLMNLAKLRDGTGDELIQTLNKVYYSFVEQDCISDVCAGGILEIPSDYNANNYTVKPKTVKITHLAAVPNWQGHPLFAEYMRRPWI